MTKAFEHLGPQQPILTI